MSQDKSPPNNSKPYISTNQQAFKTLEHSLQIAKMYKTLLSVKDYLLDSFAFSDLASISRRSNTLYKTYHKDNPNRPKNVSKPEVSLEDLMSILNSKIKAEFCLFLIEYRQAFTQATNGGDGGWWKKNYKNRDPHKFIELYDAIAKWVFEVDFFEDTVPPKKIRAAALEILDIAENNLNYVGSDTVFNPIMTQLLNLAFKPAENSSQAIKDAHAVFIDMRLTFKHKPEITNILDRLHKGSDSYNPYWMGSSKKLSAVLSALQEIKESGQDMNNTIDNALVDRKSKLYKAINHQRINFFKSEARSMEVYKEFKPVKPSF